MHIIDEDEAREIFLKHVWDLIEYWKDRDDSLSGLAFSILSSIDGCSMALPGYTMIPYSCFEDIEYTKSTNDGYPYYDRNDNYNEDGCYPESSYNISGSLHEQFFDYEPENKLEKVTTLKVVTFIR